jgi:hypothetical protein
MRPSVLPRWQESETTMLYLHNWQPSRNAKKEQRVPQWSCGRGQKSVL